MPPGRRDHEGRARSTEGRPREAGGSPRGGEPLEPGGELGETREVGPQGSADDLAGRAPRTRVVVHPPGEAPEAKAEHEAPRTNE